MLLGGLGVLVCFSRMLVSSHCRLITLRPRHLALQGSGHLYSIRDKPIWETFRISLRFYHIVYFTHFIYTVTELL